MTIDATFWVAISFIIFFLGLIYLKVPKKINELLNKLILDIKNDTATQNVASIVIIFTFISFRKIFDNGRNTTIINFFTNQLLN